jgi:N-acetylneuraminic acid mutarotase
VKEFILTGILMISIILSISSFSYCSSNWSTLKEMPSKRTELSAVSLAHNIYVIGGVMKKKNTDLVEIYDTKTNTWKAGDPLPQKRNHVAAATFENKIYVIGGFNDKGMPTNNLFIYNPNTNEWKQGADMPTTRGALTANFVNGTLYVVGGDGTRLWNSDGYDPEGVVAVNEAYDPKTNTWTKRSPMQIPRDHLASAVIDGKVYIIGGREPIGKSSLFRNLNINEVYDTKTDTWSFGHPLASYRSSLAAASVNDKIYVFGGENTERTFDNNEEYDPQNDTWKSCEPMPSARHGLGAASIEDKVYVVGGNLRPGGNGDNKNEIFDGNC